MATTQQPAMYSSAAPTTSGSKTASDEGLLAKGKKLLGLGKKDESKNENADATSGPALLPSPPLTMPSTDRKASPRESPRVHPSLGASPGRRIPAASPASSQIFERNVQEPEDSSAIPAHKKTEDSIPPALDASSLAITDSHLNPDEVEIVMHSAHQPASAAVAGSITDSTHVHAHPHVPSLKHEESMASVQHAAQHAEMTESSSNYADVNDPRRLSFISFADVVQAEHIEHDREPIGSSEALQFMSLDSTAADRSPSPVTTSSQGRNTSPHASGAASPKGADFGRARSPGSPTTSMAPTTHDPSLGGELPLQIETMRQALRKTRSGDLGASRSQPLSAVSFDDNGVVEHQPFK